MVEGEQATFQRRHMNAGQENKKTRDEIPAARRNTPPLSTHQGAPLTQFVQIDTVLGAG